MAILSAILLLGAACGDDSGSSAASDIDSQEAWCAVVEDIDAEFTKLDDPAEAETDFVAQQEIVAGIRTQLVDLEATLDLVDAEARDSVAALIDFQLQIADVYAESEGPDELGEAVEPLFEQDQSASEDAGRWIFDNCGVEV